MWRLTLVLLLTASAAFAQDSPLVALAKRTNRSKPKAKVITNETLAGHSGHVSYTAGETAATPTAQKTATPQYVGPAAPAVPQTQAATAETPATPPVAPKGTSTPASSVRNANPYSSVQTAAPLSTVRTAEPSSGVQLVSPAQNTAATSQPTSTVRTTDPNAPPH